MKTTIEIPTVARLNLDALQLMNRIDLMALYEACAIVLQKKYQPLPNHISGTSLKDLSLSTRTRNCLISADVYTLGQLVEWNEDDLLAVRNFGRLCLIDVKTELKKLNLSLRE